MVQELLTCYALMACVFFIFITHDETMEPPIARFLFRVLYSFIWPVYLGAIAAERLETWFQSKHNQRHNDKAK